MNAKQIEEQPAFLSWIPAEEITNMPELLSTWERNVLLLLSIPEWEHVMIGYYIPELEEFRCQGMNHNEKPTHFARLPEKVQTCKELAERSGQ